MDYSIRLAQPHDLPALITFMRQAYGPNTIFQSEEYLRWYLGRGPHGETGFHLESQIAVTPAGAVVGHYGGLSGKLLLNGRLVSLVWGINAYTLPEYRRFGIGKQVIEATMARHDVYGIIGVTRKVAEFYVEIGFNLFDYQRFIRYVRPLTDDTYAICRLIGQDEAALRTLLAAAATTPETVPAGVQVLTADSLRSLTWDLEAPTGTTAAYRDAAYMQWRFFAQPAMRYTVLGVVQGGRVVAYAVVRPETMQPTDHRVDRVIDLYGQPAAIVPLLRAIVALAQANASAYVDFSGFGVLYRAALLEAGFAELNETDLELLPQVSAPAVARPNMEHVCFYSTRYADEIAALRFENVYFTRGDADRDRLVHLHQLTA